MTTTSETLNRAADLIEERGWTTGDGWSADEGPLCIEGALSAAMGADIGLYGGFTTGPNLCPAGQAVREYLEFGEYGNWRQNGHGLFSWNDEARYENGALVNVRTAAEVIEVLRAAAVIEAAKENAETRAEVSA